MDCKVYNIWAKKGTAELDFMTLESDAKFEEKLNCGLKNGMINFAKFQQSIRSLKIATFIGSIYPK